MAYHHGNLREALLERAAEVIAEDGIEALSLRSLARDLGAIFTVTPLWDPPLKDLGDALQIGGPPLVREVVSRATACLNGTDDG